MSIEQPTIVDAIGIDKKTGAVHLTIADHLPWDVEHLLKLQDKINTYLAFVQSGEIFSAYPDAAGRDFMIEVICRYRPNDEASAFLQQAGSVIEDGGFLFEYGPGPTGYADDNA